MRGREDEWMRGREGGSRDLRQTEQGALTRFKKG